MKSFDAILNAVVMELTQGSLLSRLGTSNVSAVARLKWRFATGKMAYNSPHADDETPKTQPCASSATAAAGGKARAEGGVFSKICNGN